ncbi:MAG: UDP-N-acetylmuramoyl-tripeptide--D-alanyl-D-alanine ligase [Bacillota bacterium]|nr:UDP-N-acetylmuramoyl-tripeptide--D-alanyl-D-alanine ligase [Bacillota bacterium]
MDAIAVGQLVEAVRGRLASGPADLTVRGVEVDSRRLKPGMAFFALPGERRDGHEFLAAAAEAGAVCLCVREGSEEYWPPVRGEGEGPAVVAVPETLAALQALAGWYRRRFSLPVVGITGSTGKTTTKDLVASVLGARWRVAATPGNYNNEVGLPLTLFQLEAGVKAAVVELAMRGRGQIAALAALAQPTVGVVTNVGLSHLELLGSQEAIAEAKSELISSLPPDGLAVLNADDPLVLAMAARAPGRVLTYGLAATSPRADCRAEEIEDRGAEGLDFLLTFGGESRRVHLGLPGRHNVANALAAAAVGLALGVGWEAVEAGLASPRRTAGRQQLRRARGGWLVIDDSYNASPASMRAALGLLSSLAGGGRKLAVLADMLELGPQEEAAHREVGRYAAAQGVDYLAGVGERARWLVEEAQLSLGPERARHWPDRQSAAEWMLSLLRPGDVVLVKGSRAMKMEEVAGLLASEGEEWR